MVSRPSRPAKRLVLGQIKVAGKSNEITAIPKLLAMMAIEGAFVTVDAIRDVSARSPKAIIDRKADDILALKGNQGTLRDDVALFVAEQKANGFKDAIVSRYTTSSTATTAASRRGPPPSFIGSTGSTTHRWPSLKSIVVVDAQREIDGRIQTETRLYITSLVLLAHVMGPLVRSHWMVENGLHWVMNMVFRDDDCRLRTDHAPANFTTIQHMACNPTRRAPGKDSVRMKRKVAAWDDDFLTGLVTA